MGLGHFFNLPNPLVENFSCEILVSSMAFLVTFYPIFIIFPLSSPLFFILSK